MNYTENETMQMIGAENVNVIFKGNIQEEMKDIFDAHKGIYSTDLLIHMFLLGFIHGKRGKNV